MALIVRELRISDAPSCDDNVLSLPKWFGHEGGRAACAEAVREQGGIVAEESGQVVGFVTWVRRTPETAEATWMGVHRDERGKQVGTRIIEQLADDLRLGGFKLLLAMTSAASRTPVSGPDAYDDTRQFWQHRGFLLLGEFDLREWETNLALVMVRPI
ncbi:MAG: GNAT family N-acetyltransferase [Tepidiformaceae bacterium]